MLKLEKISKSLEIGITLRQRETFFTRNLLQALAIAVALHLIAVLCFHVNLFRILGSQSVFPPILVDADIGLQDETQVIAHIDRSEVLSHGIKEPKRSALQLPSLPKGEFFKPNFLQGPTPTSADLFSILNHDIYPLDFMISTKNNTLLPVQVHISGPLAEKRVIEEGTQSLLLSMPNSSHRVVYSVQIDDKMGTIFWYELKSKQTAMPIEAEARKILQAIRFQSSEDSFVTAGEIEINFNQERI